MILSFELSMPNRGSWDGRWSGEEKMFAVVKNLGRTKKAEERGRRLVDAGSFYYSWSDGWGARISVREVSPQQARKIRKQSAGFCGYNWMVDSILLHGEIRA